MIETGEVVSKEVAIINTNLPQLTFSRDQVDLIKRTVAKDTTDDELALFLYTAKKTGLDPLVHQIHAVKRWSSKDQRQTMQIQTGIDGYRLIADRTGKYAPGGQPTFVEKDGKLVSATAYVKKFTGGVWHEIAASAYWEEYVQKGKDGQPMVMWGKMPHLMLSKCAEALALRRAFPAELSGLYTNEEMAQADNYSGGPTVKSVETPRPTPVTNESPDAINEAQRRHFWGAMKKLGVSEDQTRALVKTVRGKESTAGMTVDEMETIVAMAQEQGAGQEQSKQ